MNETDWVRQGTEIFKIYKCRGSSYSGHSGQDYDRNVKSEIFVVRWWVDFKGSLEIGK